MLTSVLSTFTGAILSAVLGYGRSSLTYSSNGGSESRASKTSPLSNLPSGRVESMYSTIASFIERLEASENDNKDAGLVLDSFTEQVLFNPHYLVQTSHEGTQDGSSSSPVHVTKFSTRSSSYANVRGNNSDNSSFRKRSIRMNKENPVPLGSKEVRTGAGFVELMLLGIDSSVKSLRTGGSADACFNQPLYPPSSSALCWKLLLCTKKFCN